MENFTAQQQSVKVEELYRDTKRWKSSFQFTANEMLFLERLLNSYVFEPNTPNLFERLLDYQERLKRTMLKKTEVTDRIRKHENKLGGMLECTDSSCDLEYYRKHEQLKAEVVSFCEDFRQLKTEIFNYAGGILKKRKPTD
jgi:hypothetical protein